MHFKTFIERVEFEVMQLMTYTSVLATIDVLLLQLNIAVLM